MQLVATTRIDAFTRVKKAIDDMIATIQKEKKDDAEHKDQCVQDFHVNEVDTAKELHSKKTLTAKIDSLKQTIKEMDEAIALYNREIADLEVQLVKAKEDRDAEAEEFEAAVADQRATQELLTKALEKLKKVYALPQTKSSQPPPEGFKQDVHETGSRASSGILALMEHILADAVAMEKEAIHSEKEAQFAYEAFQQKTVDAIKAKKDAITNKTKEKAQVDEDLLSTKTEFTDTMSELEDLDKTLGDLRMSCDWLLKNFDVRQAAQDDEVNALKDALNMLSGMKK
jgi:chromosome segregation ATPase